ncbi:DJ-1/PfpI family protein [Rhizoclosmatium globosum]|uniref:D-lactate dehydratase n=1 Tax=Rhizoclosmatium globosum TaxID=329046 RepID=A0A1Y2C5E8_9FUNG|nr:DJ-1/PfpI family protein [Rhizoclosmatium globosum]|eukprot:ORY42270.1 DJ-1/PfpI family protein [Rhizoclosmatium globosum]
MKSILFVLTNHADLGTTGKKTGYWVSEVAHPYNHLKNHFNITFASPKGGVAPVDPGSVQAHADDAEVIAFLADPVAKDMIANTKVLSTLKPADYDCILYPGGHGPMYDLYSDATSVEFCRQMYEDKKIVAALCHGPAGIAQVKLSDGSYMVKGKNVTGFANTEEDAVQLSQFMPFLLEDVLKANGGIYSKTADWGSHVVVDGKLVTGQNPGSALDLAKKVEDLLA